VERRKHRRRKLWLPVMISPSVGNERLGVMHDVSERGALVVSSRPLSVGATLTMRYRVPPKDQTEHQARGKVIRVGKNREDPDGFWPHEIALQFEDELPALAEIELLEQ
jgi:hypothetical protein